jgi:hypothetical protein
MLTRDRVVLCIVYIDWFYMHMHVQVDLANMYFGSIEGPLPDGAQSIHLLDHAHCPEYIWS